MKTKANFTHIAGVAALMLLFSCGTAEKPAPIAEAPAPLTTFPLTKEKLSTEMRVPAELAGFKQVDIYAKVSSYVKDLKVDIGSKVRKGQLLIVLEAPEVSSQLAAANSRLKSQEAVYTASNSTYKRFLETSKTEGTISKNDLEQAEARKNSDYANFQAAKAAYQEVSAILNYLSIRAPFDGVISSRNVNLGAYVGPAGKGSDLPLLTLQQQDKLRLSLSVPELYAGYLNQGDELKFNVKSLPGSSFSGKIQRLSGALDTRLRAERVELDVENPKQLLLPGMVAEVVLPLNAKEGTFVVPKTAVVTSSEGIYVIRDADGKTQRVEVKKGREFEDRIEIYGDLKENDALITLASEEIKDGTPVDPAPATKK